MRGTLERCGRVRGSKDRQSEGQGKAKTARVTRRGKQGFMQGQSTQGEAR